MKPRYRESKKNASGRIEDEIKKTRCMRREKLKRRQSILDMPVAEAAAQLLSVRK